MVELSFHEPDRWRAYWRDAKVRLVVAGTADAPHPGLEATVRAVTDAWADVQRMISAFVASLDASHHVPLEPASRGGFAAGSCGFDGELTFESISATQADAPTRVELTFYTGYPDGYATFRVVLEHGEPVALTAFAS